jgi:hypothetical protein
MLPIRDGKTFLINLITKKFYYHKPTLKNLELCLWALKLQCHNLGIRKLAMPLISSGLDRVQWPVVQKIIERIFGHSVFDIYIYTGPACNEQSEWPELDVGNSRYK